MTDRTAVTPAARTEGEEAVARARPRLPALLGAMVRPIQAFFRLEASSGLLLLAAAAVALAWVNLGGAASYRALFELPLTFSVGEWSGRFTLRELVNDGLMTIFFLVVGMEIKRELVMGALRTRAQAILPAVAALGGMVAPAGIFLAFNAGRPGAPGWGIPMATDIAFCMGVLALLGRRVPHGLMVFVMALAIFDDIGGILVIALFYGHGLDGAWLGVAAVLVGALLLARLGGIYLKSGLAWGLSLALLWYALHHSGIHAAIAGVIVGLLVPARPRRPARASLKAVTAQGQALLRTPPDEELDGEALEALEEELENLQSPLARFIHALHPAVAFAIMPAFALANSGVDLRHAGTSEVWGAGLGPVAVGVAVALVAGKTVGIFTFTGAVVATGLAPMPGGASWAKLLGASIAAGIGFTVALFIANLAYPGAPALLDQAKIGILGGSLIAGLAGALLLRFTPRIQEGTTP